MRQFFVALLAICGARGGLSAEQKHDATIAAYQSAPGVGASLAFEAVGITLSDVLVIASIGFVLMQALYLAWKWRRDAQREQDRRDDRKAGVRHSTYETMPGD